MPLSRLSAPSRYLSIPLLAAASIAISAVIDSVSAAEIKIEGSLAQSVLSASGKNRVYLRLNLQALQAKARENRPSVNVALVLDRSGSMNGERIEGAKEAARMALTRLGSDDTVALVAYNHGVDVLARAARMRDQDGLERKINDLRADGTTALYAGVVEGGREVETYLSDMKVNRVILMSDGLANVGPSTPKELGELGRKLGSKGISVTTIGLGLEYNEDLMQRLASASDGNHAFAETPRDLVELFNREFGDALSVAAQDIEIEIDLKLGFKPIRILGREGAIKGERVTLRMNQLQQSTDRYVIVELEGDGRAAAGPQEIANIDVRYLDIDKGSRAEATARVEATFSADDELIQRSVNKHVMSEVTAQIATEQSEKAVELRDKGDIVGARKVLEENADYLNKSRGRFSSGAAPAPAAAVKELDGLEKKSREAASSLDGDAWDKTRKAMRYDQYKAKNRQSY